MRVIQNPRNKRSSMRKAAAAPGVCFPKGRDTNGRYGWGYGFQPLGSCLLACDGMKFGLAL